MNWKFGLFRLWVVVSLVWLAVTSTATVLDYSEQKKLATTTPGGAGTMRIQAPGGGIFDFPIDASDEEIQEILAGFPPGLSDAEKLLVKIRVIDARRNAVPPAHFPWQMLLLMIAIPLVLLVIGRAGFWIAAGFKR